MAWARISLDSLSSNSATGPGGGVGDGVAERGAVGAVAAHHEDLVERGHADEGDLAQDVLEVGLRHAELGGHLGVGRRAQQRGLERGVGLLHGAGLGPDRARHPVDGPELVDDGPPDPGDGVGLELDLAIRAEPVDGVDQPDDPVAHQVGPVDVLGKPDRHTGGDVLHEGRVQDDQLVAETTLATLLVLDPQACRAAVVVRRHASPYARGWVAPYTESNRSLLT